MDRTRQLQFVLEIDRLKGISRRTYSRRWIAQRELRRTQLASRIPQLHNYHTRDRSWREHGISAERVLRRNEEISEGSVGLWEWTRTLIARAVDEGLRPRS